MISRVYGSADNYTIEFKQNGAFWECAVPADLTDGKYVVELWAIDSHGFTAYYTGILYMFNGQAVIELIQDDIYIGFYSDEIIMALNDAQELILTSDEIHLKFIESDTVNGVQCNFILGETRRLKFEVRSKTGAAIVINEASFSLMSNGKEIQGGKCDIDGQNIYCLIQPTERGCMYLEITYVIAPETRKARINIDVA